MLNRVPPVRTMQVSTTKGTGGDVIILEEAAYCDPGFFYETVAPLMLIGRTSLLAISTLTSEINFYSRLIKMKDSLTQVFFYFTSLSCTQCCLPRTSPPASYQWARDK